jgi:hypothetical protein
MKNFFSIRNPKRLLKWLVVISLVIVAIHGLSLWAGSGQVIDENGKPLAGVFVMAKWNASAVNPVDSRTVCYDFAITQTDSGGKYSLRAMSWNFWPFFFDRQRYREFYLAGYETLPTDTLEGAVITMRRYTESAEDRLKKFIHNRYAGCMSERSKKNNLVPLYEAQYKEAMKIAKSNEEQKIAYSIKLNIIHAQVGYKEFTKMQLEGKIK